MVAPPLDLPPCSLRRIVASLGRVAVVIQASKRGRCLRSCGQELGQFIPIDAKVGKAFVGHPAGMSIEPPDRLVLSQRLWVLIELIDDLQHDPGGKGSLIAFDQIKITRRYA